MRVSDQPALLMMWRTWALKRQDSCQRSRGDSPCA